MREIKFRGWNSANKKMIDLQAITPLAIDSTLNCSGLFLPFEKDIILMQFTGLKDRNGKEIYEGDIVEFSWNPIFNEPSVIFTFISSVEYYLGGGGFVMTLIKKKQKGKQLQLFEDNYVEDEELHIALGSPILHGSGVEIISNIHENPELLK